VVVRARWSAKSVREAENGLGSGPIYLADAMHALVGCVGPVCHTA